MALTDLNKIPGLPEPVKRKRFGEGRRLSPGDILSLPSPLYTVIDINGHEHPARRALMFIVSMTSIDDARQVQLNGQAGFLPHRKWYAYTVLEVDSYNQFNFRTTENPGSGAWTHWEKISE